MAQGTRSGAGRVVQKYYDDLKELWKGSPATEKLDFGITTSDCFDTGHGGQNNHSDSEASCNHASQLWDSDTSLEVVSTRSRSSTDAHNASRSSTDAHNAMAELVDNKRRLLQKPLSAAKRDQVLMNATKEDLQLKNDFMLQMEKSQETLNFQFHSIHTLGMEIINMKIFSKLRYLWQDLMVLVPLRKDFHKCCLQMKVILIFSENYIHHIAQILAFA